MIVSWFGGRGPRREIATDADALQSALATTPTIWRGSARMRPARRRSIGTPCAARSAGAPGARFSMSRRGCCGGNSVTLRCEGVARASKGDGPNVSSFEARFARTSG